MDRDENGKSKKSPKVFDIDISVCMSCQICVEVCPFEAIKMDNEFELSSQDRFGELIFDKARLSKSNEYYRSIHPTDARVSDEGLAAKAKPKSKSKSKPDLKSRGKPSSKSGQPKE